MQQAWKGQKCQYLLDIDLSKTDDDSMGFVIAAGPGGTTVESLLTSNERGLFYFGDALQ